VTAVLNRNGYDAELLNGDLPQQERERVMAKVKRGEVRFMVATDIAARGIDISDLSHVVNYSLPEDPAVYLHRVGRTGRIGKKGTALSLATGAEGITLGVLQKKFGIVFEEKQMPTPEDARRQWTERHVHELKEGMNASIFEGFIPLAQELHKRPDGDHLVAFALKYFFSHHRIEKVQDIVKAVHKKEEHERREHKAEAPAKREAHGGRRERREGRERRDEVRGPRHREIVVDARVPSEAAPAPDGGVEGETSERPGRSRIFLNLGEADAVDEAKLRAAVGELAPGLEVLSVALRRSHSFLEVKPEDLERALGAWNGKEALGKKLSAEKARRRRR
jgi:ATP-dependent RNA helicase DeaD